MVILTVDTCEAMIRLALTARVSVTLGNLSHSLNRHDGHEVAQRGTAHCQITFHRAVIVNLSVEWAGVDLVAS